jgi:signal transduction histidine kinase
MKRPWQIWLVFALCVLAAFGGMVWLTQQALRADERRRAAEAEAELEQNISLALWKMDTELAPIIASEVIRPPGDFRPKGVRVDPPPYVLVQFEATPGGMWVSPQDVGKEVRGLSRLKDLSGAVDLSHLIAELPKTPLPTVADVGRNQVAANSQIGQPNADGGNAFEFFEGNTANASVQTDAPNQPGQPTVQPQQQEAQPVQTANRAPNANRAGDFEARGKRYQNVAQQSLLNGQQRQMANEGFPNGPGSNTGQLQIPATGAGEQVGVSRPVWVGDRLLLARRVSGAGQTLVQGCWLDWPQLKSHLLAEASDLLPNADLVPVNGDAAADPSRMLAGLPVRLVVAENALATTGPSPLRLALWMGWGAVVLAVAAAAFLLQGVITLSERRAAFVSSVTHELRTPLTTFRMYAELLARGMVPDAKRRQEYFDTLQREAERLTLLVENVLSYARLERGRRPQGQDRVTLASLLARIEPRLKQRAAQAGMECVIEMQNNKASSPCPLPEGEGFDEEFTTDQAVVEQILFNLVDNAAKYARDAADRRIHVEAGRNGKCMQLVVRDHGPGIEQHGWSRRSQPFGKSAQESAETAPGVGLGLALCRRLARQLGGRLEIDETPGDGATITLRLPNT